MASLGPRPDGRGLALRSNQFPHHNRTVPSSISPTPRVDLLTHLRSATSVLHDRLERLPFFVALLDGTLPRAAAVTLMRSLAIIHAVVERALSESSDTQVLALGSGVPHKLPLLMADLDALTTNDQPSIQAPIRVAVEFGARALVDAQAPHTLIGLLYVLEGSQSGGRQLKGFYAQCLGVHEARVSYFGCYGEDTDAHAAAFAERLTSLTLEQAQQVQAVDAAVRCFELFHTMCAALHPHSESDLGYDVAGINPEAGSHAMPQNPLEVALALRAGRAAWERYPYLGQRFGDRGMRFTSSDSCWLVSLTRMPVATATAQLRWLRGVLSSRGIPTVILKSHLEAIGQMMASELPDHVALRTRYEPFLLGLEAERQACDAGLALPALVDRFEHRLHGCAGTTVDSAAALIASAFLDERAGIAGALEHTTTWFADPARFSSDWVAAVHELTASLGDLGGSAC